MQASRAGLCFEHVDDGRHAFFGGERSARPAEWRLIVAGVALIAESQHNPDTAKSLHGRYLGPRRELERDLLARGVEAGEVSPRLDELLKPRDG